MTTEAMRAQFEAWLGSRGFTSAPERRANGTYVNGQIQGNWRAYQAALQSPAVAGLVEKTRALVQAGKRLRNTVVETRGVAGMDNHDVAMRDAEAALAPFTGESR